MLVIKNNNMLGSAVETSKPCSRAKKTECKCHRLRIKVMAASRRCLFQDGSSSMMVSRIDACFVIHSLNESSWVSLVTNHHENPSPGGWSIKNAVRPEWVPVFLAGDQFVTSCWMLVAWDSESLIVNRTIPESWLDVCHPIVTREPKVDITKLSTTSLKQRPITLSLSLKSTTRLIGRDLKIQTGVRTPLFPFTPPKNPGYLMGNPTLIWDLSRSLTSCARSSNICLWESRCLWRINHGCFCLHLQVH